MSLRKDNYCRLLIEKPDLITVIFFCLHEEMFTTSLPIKQLRILAGVLFTILGKKEVGFSQMYMHFNPITRLIIRVSGCQRQKTYCTVLKTVQEKGPDGAKSLRVQGNSPGAYLLKWEARLVTLLVNTCKGINAKRQVSCNWKSSKS